MKADQGATDGRSLPGVRKTKHRQVLFIMNRSMLVLIQAMV